MSCMPERQVSPDNQTAARLNVDIIRPGNQEDMNAVQALTDPARSHVQAYALVTLRSNEDVTWASRHLQPLISQRRAALLQSRLERREANTAAGIAGLSRRDTDVNSIGILGLGGHTPRTLSEGRERSASPDDSLYDALDNLAESSRGRSPNRHLPEVSIGRRSQTDGDHASSSHPTKSKSHSFRIDEEETVLDFFRDRLDKLQQLSGKKIAKAWIKGICPKKQAKFPYHNCDKVKHARARGEQAKIPKWWPDVDICPFTEPDHIKKDERSALLVHLLRLRPEPAQLKIWNQPEFEPHPTHVNLGWTRFLKELAPIETLDELSPQKPDRVLKRRKLFTQIYQLAEMEEEYLLGGIDGCSKFVYESVKEDEDEEPSSRVKRRRRATSELTRENTIVRDVSPDPPVSRIPNKRRRPNSRIKSEPEDYNALGAITSVVHRDTDVQSHFAGPHKMEDVEAQYAVRSGPAEQLAEAKQVSVQSPGAYPINQSWHNVPQRISHAQVDTQWAVLPTTSFGSGEVYVQPAYGQYQGHIEDRSFFPGNHDYTFAQPQPQTLAYFVDQVSLPQRQSQVQAYHTAQVPEPHFDTVPNTPMFSPTSLVHSEDAARFRTYRLGTAITGGSGHGTVSTMQASQSDGHFAVPYTTTAPLVVDATRLEYEAKPALDPQGVAVAPNGHSIAYSTHPYGHIPHGYAQ